MQDLLPPVGRQWKLQGHPVALHADLDGTLQPFHFPLLGKAALVLLQPTQSFLTAALQGGGRTNHSSASATTLSGGLERRWHTRFREETSTRPRGPPVHLCCTTRSPSRTKPHPSSPGPTLSHPAGLHLHVPLGPDHVVLVGGHGNAGPGTKAGVAGSQRSMARRREKTAVSISRGLGGKGTPLCRRTRSLTSPPRSAASPGPCEASGLLSCRQKAGSQDGCRLGFCR